MVELLGSSEFSEHVGVGVLNFDWRALLYIILYIYMFTVISQVWCFGHDLWVYISSQKIFGCGC